MLSHSGLIPPKCRTCVICGKCNLTYHEYLGDGCACFLTKKGHKICLLCHNVKECPKDSLCAEDEHDWCECQPNRTSLYNLHQNLTKEALEVMQKKNADYASEDDPYRNFREWGQVGILVRLSDKLSRLRTFTERGELSVKDETVRDTVLDAINYLVLFEGYRGQ